MSEYIWYYVEDAKGNTMYLARTLQDAEEHLRLHGHPDWEIYEVIKRRV